MIKCVMSLVFLMGALLGRAQYSGYKLVTQPEEIKKSIASTAASTMTIQSDFIQEKSLTMLSEKIISSGKFWFRQKNSMRMEYIKPYPYLLILNKDRIYIKDGEKENKISTGSSKMFQQINRIMLDCVQGRMLKNPDFQSSVFEGHHNVLIEFKPLNKNLSGLYKNINIVFDSTDFTAVSLDMVELSGDRTLIKFQNKQINVQIPETVFTIP